MGRPAINTAITAPFDTATHDMKQDQYNAATPGTAMTFEAAFQANLAILDSLDRNCGNQFAADKTKTDAGRYKGLADVLLDDQLYVDTSSGTCAVYLGVEAEIGTSGVRSVVQRDLTETEFAALRAAAEAVRAKQADVASL